MMYIPRDHQHRPLFLLNGRSGILSGRLSSAATTARLADELRRAHWISSTHLEYPRTNSVHWWSAAYRRLAAESVLAQVRRHSGYDPPDIVAHSLGCDLIREMLMLTGAEEFRRIVLIAPAMSRNYDWTRHNFERLLVIRNPQDKAILAGSLIPWHPFGLAGSRGFRHTDSRMSEVILRDKARLDFYGHSHFFRGAVLPVTAGIVDGFLTSGV